MRTFEIPLSREHRSAARVRFTTHALERLGERCWQQPTVHFATSRLERLVPLAELAATPPSWLHSTTRSADAWLTCGDLTFPLCAHGDVLVAVTCLTRGALCTSQDRRPRARARRLADRERTRARRHDRNCGAHQ